MKEYIGRDLFDEDGNVVGREYSGELIRCKNCYWYDEEDKTCVRYSFLSQPTDYCSNAERKEE